MQPHRFTRTIAPAFLASSLALSAPIAAQTSDDVAFPSPDGGSPSDFASENAILDTSIPFAIGAREAQQSLRSAFGWPTFQEGLVKGIYFRFDPDGYARFAPTPRLDTDVFEVVCRPRTLVCMGRKGSLSMTLNQRGRTQIGLSTAQEGDRFYLVSGISEFELPAQILQPLTRELELLLQSDGDIVIRRGENEVDRVSLAGVGVAAAYLRWVAAQQDYIVLPADWPVPNARVAPNDGTITRAQNWQSPMPQPQTAQLLNGYATAVPAPPGMTALESQIAQLQAQLAELRGGGEARPGVGLPQETPAAQPVSQMQPLPTSAWSPGLSQGAGIGGFPDLTTGMSLQSPAAMQPAIGLSPNSVAPGHVDLGNLVRRIEALELALFGGPAERPEPLSEQQNGTVGTGSDPGVAEKLDYMIRVIGMSPQEALEALNRTHSPATAVDRGGRSEAAVLDVLRELEGTDRASVRDTASSGYDSAGGDDGDDYLLLSDYLNAVIRDR